MAHTASEHPTCDQLAAFSSGALDEPEIAQVEQHLDRCETCLRAVDTLPEDRLVGILRISGGAEGVEAPAAPAEAGLSRGTAMPLGLQPELEVPEALARHPRYRVLRCLGSGGMGVVYLAEQRHLDRLVALKVIRNELLPDATAVERFRQEAKAAARLSHPNVVTVYDADQAGDTYFLVTEFIDGVPLSRVVKQRGPLPVALACDYARQVALGLQHSFERGIVHRDIKPQNLMLAADGTVKILDFGLARFVAESGPEGSLTFFGSGLGTPDYVAPEQARNARGADVRADLYSLGCTLYFLLAGHAPFPEGTAAEKIACHLERSPRPLRQLRSDLPETVAQVVHRLMAKDPDHRYQTPKEVVLALEPLAARPRSPDTQSPKLHTPQIAQQRVRVWLGVALLAASLAAGLLLAILAMTRRDAVPSSPSTKGDSPADAVAAPAPGTVVSAAPILVLSGHVGIVRWLDISPDGRYVASGSFDKTVRVWDVPSGREVGRFSHTHPIVAVAFSPSSRQLLFAGGETVVVADVLPPRPVQHLRDKEHLPAAAAFSPDGRQVISAGPDRTVRLWDVNRGVELMRWPGDQAVFAAFSADRRYLLNSTGGRRSSLWDMEAGSNTCLLEGHTENVRCVALSADARRALSGSDDATVRVWELPSGRQLRCLTGHTGPVRCVAFSPDQGRALSGGEDRTLRLWDLARFVEIKRLEGHTDAVRCVAISADGHFAASGGADHTVRLWDLRE